MKIDRIVYATDFTEGSEAAGRYAVEMAKCSGAKLIVLNVVFDIARTAGWNISHIDTDTLYEAMETAARKDLDREVAVLKAEYPDVEGVIIRGLPDDDLIKYAVDHGAGMIVIGTHGRHGIDRLLYGSTASKVVSNSPCPVLTVRG